MHEKALCPNCGELADVDESGLHCVVCENFIPLEYFEFEKRKEE